MTTPFDRWADRAFMLVMVVAILVGLVLAVHAIVVGEEPSDPMVLYSDRNLEVRAVCTIDSGVLVTTRFNARIAGDSVSSVRMTPGEVAVYCVEGEQ